MKSLLLITILLAIASSARAETICSTLEVDLTGKSIEEANQLTEKALVSIKAEYERLETRASKVREGSTEWATLMVDAINCSNRRSYLNAVLIHYTITGEYKRDL